MRTTDFYQLLDTELAQIVEEEKNNTYIKSQHKAPYNQKSYALLLWFLKFYGNPLYRLNYQQFVTEGNGDYSCDMILSKKDELGNKHFYVIQSKWNNEKKASGTTSRDDILKAMSEFNTLLKFNFDQLQPNAQLRPKLEELQEQLADNKQVTFIFLGLASYDGGADEHIQAFNQTDPNVHFKVIDIDTIKLDYIDRYYKDITPINPLEKQEDPSELTVVLKLAQEAGNFISINRPFEAYIVLLRPSSIHNLFKRFKFLLFQKNVRNPLLQSRFNEQIKQTAQDNPDYFWYYNNGITGIAKLLPKLGQQAKRIEVTGFQIINGAQTVYSIYQAYEEASLIEREIMDRDILVTLRLIRSGGTDFDLNVTRYTNAQNPIGARAFHANDPVQLRLQEESYKTPYWYEKRDGEFRDIPKGIEVISNEQFAKAYAEFYLQGFIIGIKRQMAYRKTGKNIFFSTSEEHEEGLYQTIFNDNTKFEELLTAYVFYTIFNKLPRLQRIYRTALQHSKAVYQKYKNAKCKTDNASIIIEMPLKKQEELTIQKVLIYTDNLIRELEANRKQDLIQEIENTPITAADIDNIHLPEGL
ncbi:MAG: AIPR family protein [Aureispira sp.]